MTWYFFNRKKVPKILVKINAQRQAGTRTHLFWLSNPAKLLYLRGRFTELFDEELGEIRVVGETNFIGDFWYI